MLERVLQFDIEAPRLLLMECRWNWGCECFRFQSRTI